MGDHMTEPFSMFDDLVPEMEPANSPGHPDGPGVVTLSVEDVVNLLRELASQYSQLDHIVVTRLMLHFDIPS
jgi:hypothetical protein